MPRGGRVTLNPERGSSLTLILLAAPSRSGGVGGWALSERSQRAPAKYHRALPDDTMSLDCLIDIDAIGGPSVERRLRVLRDMGQPGSKGQPPPVITVEGDVWTEDQTLEWVINDMTLGDRLWNEDGTLRRQQVTVGLERFRELGAIKPITIRSTRDPKGIRRRSTVQARGSDTLRAIALRELGDATRWKDIQGWNKKKLKGVDPDARLRVGTTLVIR